MLLSEKAINYILSDILVNKGKAHQELQETTNALECFNTALKLDPDCKEAQIAIENTVLYS